MMTKMALDLAEGKASDAIEKHLGSGQRMRYGGQGTQGVRLSGVTEPRQLMTC